MNEHVYPSAGGSYVRLPNGELKLADEVKPEAAPVATVVPAASEDVQESATPKAAKPKAQA